ncbi:MAG TPA: hypothetical protein V6C58_14245 [Allocoleopsis sp.]
MFDLSKVNWWVVAGIVVVLVVLVMFLQPTFQIPKVFKVNSSMVSNGEMVPPVPNGGNVVQNGVSPQQ